MTTDTLNALGVKAVQWRQYPPYAKRNTERMRRPILAAIIGCSLLVVAARGRADMALNPDVRQGTIAETICSPGYTKTVRPSSAYTNGVKRKLLREANIEETGTADFELDHIVPLALGGHPRSPANLALQPWEGDDGAKRKDRIEVKLQCLVCTGQVPLITAQQAIYRDWQAAYHRYATVKCQREYRDGRHADLAGAW